MKNIFVFSFLLIYLSVMKVTGQETSAVTFKKGFDEISKVAFTGTFVEVDSSAHQGFYLKLDNPLTVTNLKAGKTFAIPEINVSMEYFKQGDENWIGSHIKAIGTLDWNSETPAEYKEDIFLYVDKVEGKSQPMVGPVYSDNQVVTLSGTLKMGDCPDGEAPVIALDQPINVKKGGEFEGPDYGAKEVQLIGLDIRNKIKPGPTTISGVLDYGVMGGDHPCQGVNLSMKVETISGAVDQAGKPLGVREILFNSNWNGVAHDRGLNNSFKNIDEIIKKEHIPVIDGRDMTAAYMFIEGEKRKVIKDVKTPKGLEEEFRTFFGIKSKKKSSGLPEK